MQDMFALLLMVAGICTLIVSSFTSDNLKTIRSVSVVGCLLIVASIITIPTGKPEPKKQRDYQVTVDKYIILYDGNRMVDTIGTLDLDIVLIKDNL